MKIHRFYFKEKLTDEILLDKKKYPELFHQFINVLRFDIEEEIIFFNEKENFDFFYKIKNINKLNIEFIFKKKEKNLEQDIEKKIKLHLCFSIIKKENLNLILEKCTEIGVFEFLPIISERVERKNIESFNLKKSEKIILESVEQANWGLIPNIKNPEKIEKIFQILEKALKLKEILILDILNNENNTSVEEFRNKNYFNLNQFLLNLKKNSNIYLFIGPEGGWTENERKIFKKYNLNILSLGKNILRAETANILGVGIILN